MNIAVMTPRGSRSSTRRGFRCPVAGKLANLEQAIRVEPWTVSTGVGHTRWRRTASDRENAHPHRDAPGASSSSHGIIELLKLKKELQSQGHEFKTETTPKSSRTSSSARCTTTAIETRCAAR